MNIHFHDTTTTSFFFSFFILLYPFVFSQQSANQTSTMVNLSQLFNSLTFGWDVTKQPNHCWWEGVTCNGSSLVTQLHLSGFGISRSDFLSVVCQLGSLESLDVSNNRLSSIPNEFITGCGEIKGLKLLNFSKTWLSGPLPSFNGFVGLEFLDLSYNQLSGNISLLLDELVNVKSLNLSRNVFEGSIPSNLGKSKALEQLQLSGNFLQGGIPEEIADYGNLTLIDLSVNHLSGSIPHRIGELAKLEVLILSENNLTGGIPANLSSLSTLLRFVANQNNFNGTIPSGLTKYMKNLDLSYNKLTGLIPADLFSYANLQALDLSFNMLGGSIPDNISPSLVRLRLGSNLLDGVIPLAKFSALEKLTYLELDNNSLTGIIPPQLGDCPKLTLLNLAQNKLNGSLPVELGHLNNLQVLKLQLNKLNGEIPFQFSQIRTLAQLNISWNSLNGSIPSSISNLENLTNLNLQHNHLSGSIPESIGNMGSLIELQLGENQLSGRIPLMPLKLQIALNLSSNLFDGAIPDTLSRLTILEVLDLSNNKFSGDIPDVLAQMQTLTQLILSNNRLSGVVPKFGSWVSVNVSGNLGLRNATEPSSSPEQATRRISAAVALIIAVVVGALSGAVVTIIVLKISRRIYFPRIVQHNFLTEKEIHKSNISFTKAMETIADPKNIVLKTKFSIYYKSIMPSGMSYFIKKLNWSDKIFPLSSNEKFYRELEILGKLSHPNVMTPLAYAVTKKSTYLFYEYAPKGTLFDILQGSVENTLDWESRYIIAVGVAQGLAFLHESISGPILLLDLSSRKIILKSLKEPQVGDIELCKLIDPSKRTGSISTVAGTIGYIPPEYAYTMRVTKAGNVYSFGVVLLELLTGKPAVSEGIELSKLALHNSEDENKRDDILDMNISRRSLVVRSQMLAILEVAVACVSVSPEARPKMNIVLQMLQNATLLT